MAAPRLSVFDLADRHPAKADPALVADDEEHLDRIATTLRASIAAAQDRLADLRQAPAALGGAAVERDLELQRVQRRLTVLRRYGIDLCLGRMVPDDGGPAIYIGRVGLTDADGERLLVDWRTPAAGPFFAATHGDPHGLTSRRRYRWDAGRVVDYWDEVFSADRLDSSPALDAQSAFIAALGASRSPRMRDVLATIHSDQDAIIRAGSRGALVVDGGPGTGKTVVALHRAAYLLHSEPRIAAGSGGVLVVGPSRPYLSYVEDVLPSLGEEGVRTCVLDDLVPEGASAGTETDARTAALKSSARLVDALRTALALYEQPPTQTITVELPWADVHLRPDDWADAFDAPDPGSTHNDARGEIWPVLVDIVAGRLRQVPRSEVAAELADNDALRAAFDRAWPVLDPVELTAALWSTPSFLARCAPWLSADDVQALQREDPHAWTAHDLPYLDLARRLVGDPHGLRRRRQRERTMAAERRYREDVADALIEASDDDLGLMTMLRTDDVRNSLDDHSAAGPEDADPLAGPFAHIVVDEAQELTDAQWRMLRERCPSGSMTVVGDRAQARHGFPQSWQERLGRVGFRDTRLAALTVNYRTPEEVMDEAAPVIRAALPDANVPTSIRRSGVPVRRGRPAEAPGIVAAWLAEHAEGVVCVIGDDAYPSTARVRSLRPEAVKGLEFDLVVLVRPSTWGDGITGAVDRYVAMTRSTRELVILE